MKIVTVCTGNVCRSPLAEVLITTRLAGANVIAASAGTRARSGARMTEEAVDVAVALGCSPANARNHRARLLSESVLAGTHLALGMTKEHRRAIVELRPDLAQRLFTIRELARLVEGFTDEELSRVMGPQDTDGELSTSSRFAAVLAFLASRRGVVGYSSDPTADDVVDPIGQSKETYRRAASQILPGVVAIDRLVRLCKSS